MTAHDIESTAVDLNEPADQPTQPLALAPRPALAVTPSVQAGELVARLDVIRQAMETAMKDGVDYGRIPGVDKPTLLKPGAEKLGVLFQLDVQLENAKTWGPGDHLTVESRAVVFHAPTGARLGYGEGMCSSRERKYGKRKQERECPACGAAAVIKGKAEYGGGWLCWKKRDGCGAKFPAGDPAIESQDVGEIENPDLPDTWNTVLKMAEKRARVDAVLAVTGASALFTQDAEDMAPVAPKGPEGPPPVPEYVAEVKTLLRRQKVTTAGVRSLLRGAGVTVGDRENPVPLVAALTAEQAAVVLEWLRKPIADGSSDVPGAAAGEFTHPPAPDDGMFPPAEGGG